MCCVKTWHFFLFLWCGSNMTSNKLTKKHLKPSQPKCEAVGKILEGTLTWHLFQSKTNNQKSKVVKSKYLILIGNLPNSVHLKKKISCYKRTHKIRFAKNSKMFNTCKGVTNTFCPHKEWTLPHCHQNGRKGRVRIFLKSDCPCRNRILKQLSLATFNTIGLINHDSLSQILYSGMQHESLMLRVW